MYEPRGISFFILWFISCYTDFVKFPLNFHCQLKFNILYLGKENKREKCEEIQHVFSSVSYLFYFFFLFYFFYWSIFHFLWIETLLHFNVH